MKALLARLKEPSTYRGLAVLGGIVGLGLSPEHWESIGAAVAAILAVVEIFRSEKK